VQVDENCRLISVVAASPEDPTHGGIGMSKETLSSLLSCFACGSEQELDRPLKMTRASVSRRKFSDDGPNIFRSRSDERLVNGDSDLDRDSGDDKFEDSEHVDRTSPRHHRRSISDPFDTQEHTEFALAEDDDNDDFFDAIGISTRSSDQGIISTLPRYPCSATRNKNCFSEPPVSIFHVRGPDYFSTKTKMKSGPYLMKARGCDLFLTDNSQGPCSLETKYVSYR
jgi:hypothetical protein